MIAVNASPVLRIERTKTNSASIAAPASLTDSIDLSEINPTTWDRARREYAILEPLLRATARKRCDVRAAAERLGRGVTWAYEMLTRLRSDCRLTSLLPRKCGRPAGTLKLGHAREELVRVAIDEIYLTRQQPSVSALMMAVRHQCLTRGLRAPSRRAVQMRLDRRSFADVLKLRRGKKEARDRFAPVTGSLVAERPLALVQIDHTLVDVMLVDSAM